MTDYLERVAGIQNITKARIVEPYAKGNRRPAVSFASTLKKASERRQGDCLILSEKKAS